MMARQMTDRAVSPRALLVAVVALLALAAVACGGADEQTPGGTSEGSSAGAVGATTGADAVAGVAEFPYATGPAVLVSAGYEPPGDRVASTGAYLPANGKPTLVFVDAIW
jgi:hypothetical protein